MTTEIANGPSQVSAINARWHPDVARQVVRRIVVEGDLVLLTPAHFGSGDSSSIELLVLYDALEGRPLLPGASLAGALRHYLRTHQYGYRKEDAGGALARQLFGEALDNDTGVQSRVIVDDAFGTGDALETRDGVKIDGATRTADEGKLYTFQVWEAGTRFRLRFEVCIYKEDNEDMQRRLLTGFAAALDALGSGLLPLGARKHRGYGQARVEAWHVSDYDLTKTDGLLRWLRAGENTPHATRYATVSEALAVGKLADIIDDARAFVGVEGTFNLTDSLLIRAGSDVVDMVHLNRAGQAILSGTSLAGALRARAVKILNTLGLPDADAQINALFGTFGEDRSVTLTASRLIVHETEVRGRVFDRVQNRVRIDRFTGGAFDTGLFAQQPLFADGATEIRIRLELRFPAKAKANSDETTLQTGLLLMLLKDLWTGDLPLGGESSVGRGRLYGRSLAITIKDGNEVHKVTLTANPDGTLNVDQPALLETYAAALRERAQTR